MEMVQNFKSSYVLYICVCVRVFISAPVWVSGLCNYMMTSVVLKLLTLKPIRQVQSSLCHSPILSAVFSRGKSTSGTEQNALSYVNCIILDVDIHATRHGHRILLQYETISSHHMYTSFVAVRAKRVT